MDGYRYKGEVPIDDLDNRFELISEGISKLELPKGFLDFLLYIIAELFGNVKEHSMADKLEIHVEITEKNCFLAVVDKGIGFRKSYILREIYPKDDSSAIEFALAGLSTKNAQERGYGLYSIKRLVESIGGEMTIESGEAQLVVKNVTSTTSTEYVQGVVIKIEVPLREVDVYKVIS